MDRTRYTREQINTLPNNPGIYQYYNSKDEIIYVGKAKNIKKRVQSYFLNKNNHNRKTLRMVSEISYLEIIIVNSELDALLLENNLIKSYQPKYNIQLKDDKSYPYILITNDPFPKVYPTRQVEKGKGHYFGPYSNVKAMNTILELFREIFHIRTCKLNLTERNIAQGKFEVCLEYHIGKCKAPCVGKINKEEYQKEIDQVIHILKGHIGPAKQFFKEAMLDAASKLEFEQAELYKQQLLSLEKFQAKTVITTTKLTDLEVFTIVSDEKYAYINFMSIIDGAIKYSKTIQAQYKLEESEEEILKLFIIEIQEEYKSECKEILSNINISEFGDYLITVPKIGDKKKLVELSVKNALFYKKERLNQKAQSRQDDNRILKTAAQDLRLTTLPRHIECFDNSNIQGTNPVASMVCFKNGKPSKKDYRHFNIKTVIGPNDFDSMTEIVQRRYSRLIRENIPLPDLIVIDGGKGQLNAAVKALKELNIYTKIPIIGIAKRLEELYYPEDSFPLMLSKKSETLKLIQQLRDEAHRFAITFHRDKRSKSAIQNEFDSIKGIGENTITALLKAFKSTKKVKEASFEEIKKVIGEHKATLITQHIKKGLE
ncbi:excinuclease ABC subunit UvrC [Aureibacter tunicatorum]|uniref:UvrABC system protein C n=1 Tax=Aureibacter tunicatorum TaxID=866807 RepID=A0AAE3XJK1_9BACT|nr:excinuclease ABC subunit UvrC [Aureibacter tunicatorum]MDR6237203.1 excinuclease ABC subunit C [Aureibacter tunicatorum]BDD06195.1 UvrABC system protein C [Aureibacter tunicatorum]